MLSTLAIVALLQGPSTINRSLLEETVQSQLKTQKLPGAVVAVAVEDSVVLVEAFGARDLATGAPMRDDDIFLIGSMTKLFTATLLAQLEEQGKLSLDDPVAKHLDNTKPLPEWTRQVTVRQLANHTSGLPRDPVNRRNLPDSPGVMLPYSRTELYRGLAQTKLDAEPGARWSYSNLGYAVLGEVVESASGRPYETQLKESLLMPLGLKDTGITISPEDEKRIPSGYWVDREPIARPRWQMGEVVSFAGMHSTARELAQFLIAQTATGPGATFSSTVRTTLQTASPGVVVAPGRSISLGWFIESLPGGLRAIGGGGEVDSFSGTLAFFERPRIGIVVLTNRGASAGAEGVIREVMTKVLTSVLAKR